MAVSYAHHEVGNTVLDAVLDASLDAEITTDGTGTVVHANRAAETLFGYRREDVFGRSVSDLVPPIVVRRQGRRTAAREAPGWPGVPLGRRTEMTAIRADGAPIPIALTVSRSGFSPPRYTAWVRDLSDAKRADDRASRQARMLRDTEESAGSGSWEWNVETGEVRLSENLLRMLGLESGVKPSIELIAELRHPDDDEFVRAMLDRARTTGTGSAEHRVRRGDGSIGYVRHVASALEWRGGRPNRIAGVITDATDERLAEQEIQAQHAVAGVFAEWPSFEEGLMGLLRGLGTAMDWVAGAIWLPDGDVLACHTFWRQGGGDLDEFEVASRKLRFPQGSGLPGEAWERGAPVNLGNVLENPSFRRRDRLEGSGLRGALAFPAIEDGDVLAVFEFYSLENRSLPDRLMQTLIGISQEIGYFLSQRRGELSPTNLTPRELEVLQLAARGGSGPKIAAELFVSPSTVKTHFEHIYDKLDVDDRPSAVATALRLGLIE